MADLTNPIFHDETKARAHFEGLRWPEGRYCPHCGETEKTSPVKGKTVGLYYCNSCKMKFSATVGTVYERSHIPLHKWLAATHLMASSKKGISAHQIHRMLGITYKSAWFMCHRIREAMVDTDPTPPEEEQPFRLSEDDQKVIATWAIMKVMVVNHSMVHHTQRKQMRTKVEPPDGWAVWIGHYKRTGAWKGEWLSRPFPVIRDDVLARRRSKIAKANSHATTIILQNLFIHVAYCRDRRLVTKWRFYNIASNAGRGPITGHLFKIWPPIGHGIVWPQKVLTDQDAMVISDAIINGVMTVARRLGLVQPTPPPITHY